MNSETPTARSGETLPVGISREPLPHMPQFTLYCCDECGRTADGWAVIEHRVGCSMKHRAPLEGMTIERAAALEIVREVAAFSPMTTDDYGTWCHYCAVRSDNALSMGDDATHDETCLWQRARRLIAETGG